MGLPLNPLMSAGSLYCTSVPQNKLEGTVWSDMDDGKVFKILDLDDLEKTFSAYQRQQVSITGFA